MLFELCWHLGASAAAIAAAGMAAATAAIAAATGAAIAATYEVLPAGSQLHLIKGVEGEAEAIAVHQICIA